MDPSSPNPLEAPRTDWGKRRTRFTRGKEVADKGKRSFLRQGESYKHYNTKGTVCQCLFSV